MVHPERYHYEYCTVDGGGSRSLDSLFRRSYFRRCWKILNWVLHCTIVDKIIDMFGWDHITSSPDILHTYSLSPLDPVDRWCRSDFSLENSDSKSIPVISMKRHPSPGSPFLNTYSVGHSSHFTRRTRKSFVRVLKISRGTTSWLRTTSGRFSFPFLYAPESSLVELLGRFGVNGFRCTRSRE